jgi:RNA polymerase sigma-70 factor (ECF subfamily)
VSASQDHPPRPLVWPAAGAASPARRWASRRAADDGSDDARRVKNLALAGRLDEARESFSDLVAAHQRPALRLALYLLRDPAEADEAVQDAFVKVFTHIATYREDLPFEAWFRRILVNTCRDRRKSRMRRQRWEFSGEAGDSSWSVLENAAAATPTPEERVLSRETGQTVLKAIDALPARQREVLLLCHAEGRSPKEVGALTGLNESTVRVHLFRALRKLRAVLEDTRGPR